MATEQLEVTPPEALEGIRASGLADLLGNVIFDAEDAATFLGIAKNSVDYAMFRGRLPYVQYGPRRLLTKADLEEYNAKRGRGRDSRLEDARVYIRKAGS